MKKRLCAHSASKIRITAGLAGRRSAKHGSGELAYRPSSIDFAIRSQVCAMCSSMMW
jgi:hypothetical protein